MPFEIGESSTKNLFNFGYQKLENKFKALVVDDNPINRKIMKFFLTRLKVESEEVENGKEAVDLYLAGAYFDIILMDKEMPIMDGPQATRILRSMGVRTKIVGVSAHSRDEEIQEFMDAGIDEFHAKPMNLDQLEVIINNIV